MFSTKITSRFVLNSYHSDQEEDKSKLIWPIVGLGGGFHQMRIFFPGVSGQNYLEKLTLEI